MERLTNNYENLQKVGEGGYSNVYLGVSKKTQEIVAIKMLLINTKSRKTAYKREKRILTQLPYHPNVCQLKSTLKITTRLGRFGILVLEKMEMDLLSYLLSKGKLFEYEVKTIFKKVCEGVLHCHRSSIAHLDLKPDNVLVELSPCGQKVAKVKLCDFGFARKWKSPNNSLKRSNDSNCGTAEYRAPEIHSASGSKVPLDKADVWSLGIMLFSLVTGFFPFLYDNGEIVSKIQLEYVKEFTDGDLCYNLISKMLSEDPNLRPSVENILKDDWIISD